MTYNVFSGTLNPTHSLTLCLLSELRVRVCVCARAELLHLLQSCTHCGTWWLYFAMLFNYL